MAEDFALQTRSSVGSVDPPPRNVSTAWSSNSHQPVLLYSPVCVALRRYYILSPKGCVVSCRFHGPLVSFCLSVGLSYRP